MERVIAGRYVLERSIGRGGMGTVFAARHVLTGEKVALKLISDHGVDHEQILGRFRREVAVAARVGHPGIVRVQDAGQDELGALYLVMELLQGSDLQDYLSSPAFDLECGLAYVREALDPLAAAHRKGVVHRDLKPQNIFLHRGPEGLVVKLLDFGIARYLGDNDQLTRTHAGIGTPQFMSPEQATQARRVGPATDVWSMGVILYRMIEGRLPFDEETPFNTLLAVCERPAPTPRASSPLASRLLPVILACLEKDPSRRPQDACELAHRLDEALFALEGPAVTGSSSFSTRERPLAPPPTRGRTLSVAIPIGLLLLMAGATWWVAARAPTAPAPAVTLEHDPDSAREAPARDPATPGSGEENRASTAPRTDILGDLEPPAIGPEDTGRSPPREPEDAPRETRTSPRGAEAAASAEATSKEGEARQQVERRSTAARGPRDPEPDRRPNDSRRTARPSTPGQADRRTSPSGPLGAASPVAEPTPPSRPGPEAAGRHEVPASPSATPEAHAEPELAKDNKTSRAPDPGPKAEASPPSAGEARAEAPDPPSVERAPAPPKDSKGQPPREDPETHLPKPEERRGTGFLSF